MPLNSPDIHTLLGFHVSTLGAIYKQSRSEYRNLCCMFMSLWCISVFCNALYQAKFDKNAIKSCGTFTCCVCTCWTVKLTVTCGLCVAGSEDVCSHGRQRSRSSCLHFQYWGSGHRQGQHARRKGGSQPAVSSKYWTHTHTHTNASHDDISYCSILHSPAPV